MQKCLIVKEDGLIYVAEVPEHPKDHPNIKSGMDQYSEPLETNGFWLKQLADYEKALASAKESAVLVSDQEKARKLLVGNHGKSALSSASLDKPKPGIYPIPDLRWDVKEKLGVDESCQTWDDHECFCPYPCGKRKVAILKESTPSDQQESQHDKSLRLLDEYMATTTPEEKQAVIDKVNRMWAKSEQESQEELWDQVFSIGRNQTSQLLQKFTITRKP